jgi:hypothetical protein
MPRGARAERLPILVFVPEHFVGFAEKPKRRYFKTESPLRDHEASPLTAVDRESWKNLAFQLAILGQQRWPSANGNAPNGQRTNRPRPLRPVVEFAVFRPFP